MKNKTLNLTLGLIGVILASVSPVVADEKIISNGDSETNSLQKKSAFQFYKSIHSDQTQNQVNGPCRDSGCSTKGRY